MKPPGGALTAAAPRVILPTTSKSPIPDGGFTVAGVFSLAATLKPPRQRRFYLRVSCTSEKSDARTEASQYSSQFGNLASEPRAGIESLNFEAMRRAAISLSKLADTAREELPSTMAAIRLSGMEISDLTLELSDLSQEIADGVNKSAQAVQAAEAGVRQIGSLARQQTMGAAKKTSRAVGQAAKNFLNIISPGEHSSTDEYDGPTDRT